ncbi:MAG: flagellar basal body-associated FliL family protein [Treponema sp.]|jgi:flagellar basal body-associated protein FliL|nr:flagellar basal body-associated FliL family protein [Treponema sp.]
MMLYTENRPSRLLLTLYRVLLVITILLALVLLGGTLYALVFFDPAAGPLNRSPATLSAPAPGRTASSPSVPEEGVFTGIGRIRANTADDDPGTVILFVTFPYAPEDRAFSEELVARLGDFRNATRDYFGSLREEELRSMGEDALKEELLRRYNALLRLGRIEILYFNDFMIVD